MASSSQWSGDLMEEFRGSAIAAGNSKFAEVCDDEDYWVVDLLMGVPLDYRVKGGVRDEDIAIHASIIYGKKSDNIPPPTSHKPTHAWSHYAKHSHNKPFLVYLCGGPGDGNTYTKTPAVNKFAIERGYQVLHLDYRGTGNIPFQNFVNPSNMDSSELAEYLTNYTQDNIVLDLESVRLWLVTLLANEDIKFTLLAQSFGGWVAMSYLSYFPSSIKEILLTAAMPPFTKTPQEVYKSLYKRVINRNEQYYKLYPEDVALVRKVVRQLFTRAHKQHNEGTLFEDRRRFGYDILLTLGRLFGGAGRGSFDKVHNFLLKISDDLDQARHTDPLPEETLAQFASKNLESFRLRERPLYGLLHEAIYCHSPGIQPNWAAFNVGIELGSDSSSVTSPSPGSFAWLNATKTLPDSRQNLQFIEQLCSQAHDTRLYFTGEMIHPFMINDIERGAAEELAQKQDWHHLYDPERIRKNAEKVPVKSVVYKGDMYVDWEVSLEMGAQIGGPCKVYLVSPGGDVQLAVVDGTKLPIVVDADESQMNGIWEWTHGAVKQAGKTEKVLGLLFDGVTW